MGMLCGFYDNILKENTQKRNDYGKVVGYLRCDVCDVKINLNILLVLCAHIQFLGVISDQCDTILTC